MVFAIHHIIFDAWSIDVLTRELVSSYDAFRVGKNPHLEPLPVQYADFSVWQRQWLNGPTLEKQLDYWTKKLSGPVAPLRFQFQRPRPPVPTFGAATKSISLPADLSSALHTLSRAEGATLFMVLLAALKAMLYRHTAQEDIRVGTWIANRRRTELEHLIGFCSNTLVLRTQVIPKDTFRDLLRRVREVCHEAYAHQDLPFECLVNHLNPDRNALGTPLFQIGFSLQNASTKSLETSSLVIEPLDIDTGKYTFDLVVNVVNDRTALTAYANYSTDLFSESAINILLTHFQKILSEVTATPDLPLLQIPFHEEFAHRTAAASGTLSELKEQRFDFPLQS